MNTRIFGSKRTRVLVAKVTLHNAVEALSTGMNVPRARLAGARELRALLKLDAALGVRYTEGLQLL
jgi:hypothetical protein